jgi:predicted ATPase
LLEDTRRHPHRRLGACSGCIRKLEEATALYRGNFLANFGIESEAFEEWITSKREHAHVLVLRALSEVTDYHLRCRNHAEAVRLAQRQLELDSLNDVGHHQLMQALAADDRRNAALILYNRYDRLLARELHVGPPQKTFALYQQLASKTWEQTTWTAPLSPHNLPALVTPLIGYETELAQVAEHLAGRDTRLLTLAGPSGSGKTTLSIHAGWSQMPHFRDGVYFANLSQTRPDHLLETIIASLPIAVPEGVATPIYLWRWLRNKELLLILDHFDHLVGRASLLLKLLQVAPEVSVLVTSREWLKLRGETVLIVRGLDFPTVAEAEQAAQFSAVRFFLHCARRVAPHFALETPEDRLNMARLCRIVGGLPLALQIAAYWVNIFSLSEIATQVGQGLDFLTTPLHHIPQHERSMIAAFLSSWRQLAPREQQLFCRLAIFRGAFNLEAAHSVAQATPDVLLGLQTKSLLRQSLPDKTRLSSGATSSAEGAGRFEIPELFRIFGVDALQQQSAVALKMQYARHSRYYLDFLHRQAQKLADRPTPEALAAIQTEMENIGQAWEWAVNQQLYAQIAQAQYDLIVFYTAAGQHDEAAQVFDQAMEVLSAAGLESSLRPSSNDA